MHIFSRNIENVAGSKAENFLRQVHGALLTRTARIELLDFQGEGGSRREEALASATGKIVGFKGIARAWSPWITRGFLIEADN